jgi:hypothetical protein
VKDAVLAMKNGIELLEQLDKELVPDDLMIEQTKGVRQEILHRGCRGADSKPPAKRRHHQGCLQNNGGDAENCNGRKGGKKHELTTRLADAISLF